MLNDKLEKKECIRQLKSFHSAGWGRVITRTFIGLRTNYLSEEWLSITEKIIKKAKESGMKVWLQEADKNAAAYMPTAIPGMEERFRHQVLIKKEKSKPVDENEEVIYSKEGVSFYKKKIVPKGDWAKLLCVLDLMNHDTVLFYLNRVYNVLFEKFGEEFGKTVEAIWVDEPLLRAYTAPSCSLPWTNDLPEIFKKKWGYSVLENLSSLFSDEGDFIKIRHHFWRTVVERFNQSYFQQVFEWCNKHNIKFSGHLMGEDTLYSQICWSGAIMPHYEFMQLPGIDHLTYNLNWPSGDPFILTPKQCSSVAHQLNKEEVLGEMYGICPQGLTFEGRRWIAHWMAVLGINCRCYHGSYYSIKGRRKRFYPPHLSYQQPWWPDNKLIADYFGHISYALRQGKYHADILIIHSLESAYSFYTPDEESTKIKELNQSLISLSYNLMKIRRSFDYGDEILLAKYGKVTENGISVGEMDYKVVILPSVINLRRSTLGLLERFFNRGGKILSVGELPSRIDGIENKKIIPLNEGIIKLENTPQSLKQAIDSLIPQELEIIGADGKSTENIWIHSRKIEGGKLFFMVNTTLSETRETILKFYGLGKLECWNLQTGGIEKLPQHREGTFIVTKLSFSPAASHLVFFNNREKNMTIPEGRRKVKRDIPLKDTFCVRRFDPNCLTLDFCRYREKNGDWSEVLPIIGIQGILEKKHYAGEIFLRFEFFVKKKPESIFIVIEDAAEYEIKVNKKTVKYEGLPYYRDINFHPVDINDMIQPGKNIIELSTNFQAGDSSSRRDLERLYGTELEAIYLIGDFAVKGEISSKEQKPNCLRFLPEFVIDAETGKSRGDLLIDGYPFYNGKISLYQSIELPLIRNGKIFIEIEGLKAALARVKVNGSDAGAIVWQPYRIETSRLWQKGRNTLEIELTSSLRNLLGPFHRSVGETDSVWNTDFFVKEDDYFFIPFGFSGCRIIIEDEQ
jgi:hypothetical protein